MGSKYKKKYSLNIKAHSDVITSIAFPPEIFEKRLGGKY